MTYGHSGRRQRVGYFFALCVFAAAGAAAYWAVTTLFAVELQQTGQWLQAKLAALWK